MVGFGRGVRKGEREPAEAEEWARSGVGDILAERGLLIIGDREGERLKEEERSVEGTKVICGAGDGVGSKGEKLPKGENSGGGLRWSLGGWGSGLDSLSD